MDPLGFRGVGFRVASGLHQGLDAIERDDLARGPNLPKTPGRFGGFGFRVLI